MARRSYPRPHSVIVEATGKGYLSRSSISLPLNITFTLSPTDTLSSLTRRRDSETHLWSPPRILPINHQLSSPSISHSFSLLFLPLMELASIFMEKGKTCGEYLRALEEEKKKIQVFQRELPLSLLLVNYGEIFKSLNPSLISLFLWELFKNVDFLEAIESCRRQTATEPFLVHVEEEPISDGAPSLEEFVPLNLNSRAEEPEEESGKKNDWLKSVQLWTPNPNEESNVEFNFLNFHQFYFTIVDFESQFLAEIFSGEEVDGEILEFSAAEGRYQRRDGDGDGVCLSTIAADGELDVRDERNIRWWKREEVHESTEIEEVLVSGSPSPISGSSRSARRH